MDGDGLTDGTMIELPQLRVPDLERIRNAKRQRERQIKEWLQYDRKMQRESERMNRKGLSASIDRNRLHNSSSVKFSKSLIFLEAAGRGDLEEVRKLLNNGACPNVSNEDGLTALHQCCIDNSPEMCRLLLRHNADPNAQDSELWTPLHAAATCEHTEICQILIDNGADLLSMNADGNMPYECCPPGPTLSLIENAMDARGVTQEDLDNLHRQPECEMLTDMENLFKAGVDLNLYDHQGATMLHIAAACGFEEVAIFLLKHGAKADLPDRDGWLAIHVAAYWGHIDIIQVLVNYGADMMATTSSGDTVFHICEDPEMSARLNEIKAEAERKFSQMQEDASGRHEKPKGLVRRRSSTNPRSSSIRRTSMRDKKMISRKEARQEAEMRGLTTLDVVAPDPASQPSADSEVKEKPMPDGQHMNGEVANKPQPPPLLVAQTSPSVNSSPRAPNRTLSPTVGGQSSPNMQQPSVSTIAGDRITSLRSKPQATVDGKSSKTFNGVSIVDSQRSSSRKLQVNAQSVKSDSNADWLATDANVNGSREPRGSSMKPEVRPCRMTFNGVGGQTPIGNRITLGRPPIQRQVTQGQPRNDLSITATSPSYRATRETDPSLVVLSDPIKPRSEAGRRQLSHDRGSTRADSTSTDLSTHNAYYSPPPNAYTLARGHVLPVESVQGRASRSSLHASPIELHGTRSKSAGHAAPHQRQGMSGKTNGRVDRRLIEYNNIDPTISNKCCSLM